MTDEFITPGAGGGVAIAAAIWGLVKVLKKDHVSEALEALRAQIAAQSTQIAVLLDRHDEVTRKLENFETRVYGLESAGRTASGSGTFKALQP